MKIEYGNQIKSVFVNKVRIGFITRRFTLMTCSNEVENDWLAVPSIFALEWKSGFANRKEAREWLMKQTKGE